MAESKSSIRQRLLARRQGLAEDLRRDLDRAIGWHLLDFVGASKPQRLAAYSSFRGEPDLETVLADLHRLGHRVHLPVLHDAALRFAEWRPAAATALNVFGIQEPSGASLVDTDGLDAVFMPLVGFSPDGARLGMGGGYYDRAFEACLNRPGDGPRRVGIAYACQQVESLPIEPWDVPLHAVITERGLTTFPT
ncbi:MAG: 5-formyltetrahydrofolate cyclo-ligase [Pseudomonadota bacterium]